ncbi:MAG: aminotransferase class V-fold PLP-dependent enzyme [candidate division KSB1 bacterium]|nr:aminotransferase class V-fold PLP-dependent enzyme [candidate division KSB1 bacterium]MDZ7412608.1 aminotransferase class V-fold PLP-dependent enzyme [candidate division KSB1 bacterium]
MYTRREFLGAITVPAAAAVVGLDPLGVRRALTALAGYTGTPQEAAEDEALWFEVQQAFAVDRTIINLNNGAVSPSPAPVLEALHRHWDFGNKAPCYTMWQVLEPQRESVRRQIAAAFGCDAEEIALTRNASEGLEICQFGLDLRRGDEVLTTNQDYPRMITTWRQRERREGIVLRQFSLPVPAEDPDQIVSLFAQHITAKTRAILICHVINLTGQILPVNAIVQMARGKGIPVIVDGAHAFAHLHFSHADLDCDFYATSLHKWLCAPHGTGFLYVRKDRIRELWPLMAAPAEMDDNIRKFEEIGTHPAAPYLAIAEALAFHAGVGPGRKQARLLFLRDRWARRLLQHDRVRLHTSLKPGVSCGLATFQIGGIDSGALAQHLWDRHRILVSAIKHPEFEGIRVSPHIYTTLEELDRFCDAVEKVIKHGLPRP